MQKLGVTGHAHLIYPSRCSTDSQLYRRPTKNQAVSATTMRTVKEYPPCEWREYFFSGPSLTVSIDIRTSPSHPGKASCEYCATYSKKPWFLAKNLPQHLKCASHIKSAVEGTWECLSHIRSEELKRLQRLGDQYALPSRPNRPKASVRTKPPPGTDEQRMWDEYDFAQLSESRKPGRSSQSH